MARVGVAVGKGAGCEPSHSDRTERSAVPTRVTQARDELDAWARRCTDLAAQVAVRRAPFPTLQISLIMVVIMFMS